MTTVLPPKSAYFEKPEIDVSQDDVLLFSCLKNEVMRLPYFLDYYREKGIKQFFVIDNASTDGSGEFLKQQPDVHYFYTEMSYKGSSAGRLWMQELCDFYGTGKWCLTADVDEMLVWPGAEHMTLPELCTYLDIEGSAGLFTIFLDMYSDKPLSDTIYEPGEPFLEVCPYFETETYIIDAGSNPPYLSVFGGPRGKKFVNDPKAGNGPMMKKIPLIKWFPGFSYIYSTHSHKYVPLSDITGAMLHFKFFDFFTELAAYENKRGDRRQTQDYAHYANTMTGEQRFFNKHSIRYESSRDLVKNGVMRANKDFQDFAMTAAAKRGPAISRDMRQLIPHARPNPAMHPTGKFTIASVAAIWPFVHNPRVAEHFSDGNNMRRFTNRSRFIEQARKGIRIPDLIPEGLLTHVPEAVILRHVSPRLSFALYQGEDLLTLTPLIPEGDALQVDEGSLLPSIYRVPVDWGTIAKGAPVIEDLRIYLVPDELAADGFLTRTKRKNTLEGLGPELFSSPGYAVNAQTPEASLALVQMDGVIERVDEGHIIGWIKDKVTENWRNTIAVYMNGRFAGTITPGSRRASLGRADEEAFIYRFPLPLEYFYERGETDIKIDVRVQGRGAYLRRSPLQLSGGGRDFGWDRSAERWDVAFSTTV